MATHFSRIIAITLALLVLVIGAEYVRASMNHYELIKTGLESPSYTNLLPAELDPVFQQKLTKRMRGPFERSHPAQPQI